MDHEEGIDDEDDSEGGPAEFIVEVSPLPTGDRTCLTTRGQDGDAMIGIDGSEAEGEDDLDDDDGLGGQSGTSSR